MLEKQDDCTFHIGYRREIILERQLSKRAREEEKKHKDKGKTEILKIDLETWKTTEIDGVIPSLPKQMWGTFIKIQINSDHINHTIRDIKHYSLI